MIKIWGIVMIIVSAALIGWQLSMNLKNRIKLLSEIKFVMEEIGNEVCFGKEILAEIIRNTLNKTDGTCRYWLSLLTQNIEGPGEMSFAKAWTESLSALEVSEITKEDIEMIEHFGTQVSNLNEERLSGVILTYIKNLNERIEQLKKDYAVKGKMYRSLGILAGVFIIIIVI